MIAMFVYNMVDKRFPFGQYQISKSYFSGHCTPVEMVADAFYPEKKLLTPFLFPIACNLSCDGLCHMPQVEIMLCQGLFFSYPFGNAVMSV